MSEIEKKVKRVLDLEKAIQWAREHGDNQALTQYCILLTLEKIEDRLSMIASLLKER